MFTVSEVTNCPAANSILVFTQYWMYTVGLNRKKSQGLEFFSQQTKHGSAGLAAVRTLVVHKQAAEHADGQPCRRVTVRVAWNHGKVTLKDVGEPLPPRSHRDFRSSRSAPRQGAVVRGCQTGGPVVTLRSGRGPMTLSPSGSDSG